MGNHEGLNEEIPHDRYKNLKRTVRYNNLNYLAGICTRCGDQDRDEIQINRIS
jgi:hypothetical protein